MSDAPPAYGAPPSYEAAAPPVKQEQQQYPPQQQQYPPQQQQYPPQQQQYPPQQQQYPPQQQQYPPQQQQYPPQQQQYGATPVASNGAVMQNLSVSIWSLAWLTLLVFLWETFDKRDNQSLADLPYEGTMRAFPSLGIVATLITFGYHVYCKYYNHRPWVVYEAFLYGGAIAFFGSFLNIGVLYACISNISSFADIQDCNDNYQNGELAVPLFSMVLAGGLWVYFRQIATQFPPAAIDRTIEGIWSFEKINFSIISFFITVCAIGFISYREKDCRDDATSEDDIETCNTVTGVLILLFNTPLFLIFVYFNFVKPSPSKEVRAAIQQRMSLIGRVEYAFFINFMFGFIAWLYVSSIVQFCEGGDGDCSDFQNNAYLVVGFIMFFGAIFSGYQIYTQNKTQQPPQLNSVPSQPATMNTV